MSTTGRVAIALFGSAASLVAVPAAAAWDYTAGVDAELYSVGERRDGGDDSNDAFAGVTPFIGIAGTGERLSFGAVADVRYRRSLDSGDDEVEPGLGATAGAVLVERVLRIDANASSRFRDTSPIAAARAADLGDLGDLGDTGGAVEAGGDGEGVRTVDDPRFARVDSLDFGPTFSYRLGERTRLSAAYRLGIDSTNEDDAPDGTRTHSLDVATRTWLDRERRTSLGLEADADRATADGGLEATATAAVANLVHAFGPKLAASLSLGVDRVQADAPARPNGEGGEGGVPVSDDIDESGAIYGAGIAWRPVRGVTALASWTERSYGSSPAVSLSIEGRRSAVRLGWTRSLALDRGVDPAGLSLADDIGDGLDAPDDVGRPGTDVAGLDDGVQEADIDGSDELDGVGNGGGSGGLALFARDLATVDERITLDYTLGGRVTDIGVGLAHVRRETIGGGDATSGTSIAFGIARDLGRRATLAFDARYAVDDDRATPSAAEPDEAIDARKGDVHRTRVGLTLRVELR